MEVNAEQLRTLLETAIEDPKYMQPFHIWGPPGIGKSAIVRQVADDNGLGFVDLRLVLMDPTDLRGIPAVVDETCSCVKDGVANIRCPLCKGEGETSQAKWLPSTILPMDPDSKGILFLDELTSAPPMTQAGAYQLTLDRAIGEYKLPDGWYICAAGNRIGDRAIVHRMSTALASRFTHLELTVDLDRWVKWAYANTIDPNIIAFLSWRPELLFTFEPTSSEHAFACPRTWEFAHRLVTKVHNRGLLSRALEGTVGKGATAEFMSFLKLQKDLPDLQEIFDGKDFVPTKTDLKYALVAGLAGRAKGPKQYERLLKYSEALDREFAVLLITMLVHRDEKALVSAPSFDKWTRENQDIILPRSR